MIIIDKDSESKLIKFLQELKVVQVAKRCIHLKFSKLEKKIDIKAFQSDVIKCTDVISSDTKQIYFCDDGDAFIFADMITSKEAKQFITDISSKANISEKDFANFHELKNDNINTLLFILSDKAERYKKEAEEKKKEVEQKMREIKRNSILNAQTGSLDGIDKRSSRNKPELMIIEDDTFSRRLVKNVLKEYNLTSLENADNALAMYMDIMPDTLFLDINLPDVTGHELLEKILKLDPNAYVIMLSGYSDKKNIVEAINKGAKGFIAKPFTPEKLFQYIEKCPTIRH